LTKSDQWCYHEYADTSGVVWKECYLMQESLGHRLRLMRVERGLSLREAARRAGVVKETISDIERGHSHPYDVTLAKLAKVYEVPVEDLLEEPALAGKAEAPDQGRSAPEAFIHDPYGWVRHETTEDLQQMALEEAQYAKAPIREEWVAEYEADQKAWREEGRRRTMAYAAIDAINAELVHRGVRSPVELALKQYNEVMGNTDSVPQETGLASADPSTSKLTAASFLEEIAELWALQLERGFYDRRTLAKMHVTGYVLAHYHEGATKHHRETLPPPFRAQLEAAEERFAEVVAQIWALREVEEDAARRAAEREKVLAKLRGAASAKAEAN
jgi:transcriptional regulator with XRE-family HTH domain